MVSTERAAMVGIQKDNTDWQESPGTILITDDGTTGRVYLQKENICMAANLGDLIDAIKTQLAGGSQ